MAESIDSILRDMCQWGGDYATFADRIAKARAAELDELRRLAESWNAMGDDLMSVCAADINSLIDKAQS